MPRVTLPDGRIVTFPDTMSQSEIVSAIEEIGGGQQQATAEPKEERSIGGFLGNVLSSGGRFIADTAEGAMDLAKFAGSLPETLRDPMLAAKRGGQIVEAAKNAPRMLSMAGQAIKNRYGGTEQIADTLYNDPVGVLGDVSTVLGVGAPLKFAKGAKLAKAGSALGAASDAVNPARLIGKPIAAGARGAANAIVQGTLRPPAAVRKDFGGAKAIADTVLDERVFSDARATRKLDASVAGADELLAARQAAGTPGVSRVDLARSVLGEPKDLIDLDTRLGVPSAAPALNETAKAIFKNNPSEIPLTDAQAMKRRAQKLAYEAGADNLSIKKAAEQAKAGALRAGIEQRVPEVGPMNERSQRLMGAQRAFQSAEDRQSNFNTIMTVLGGVGGTAAGSPMTGIATAALIRSLNSPKTGAFAGIGLNEAGKLAGQAELHRAALLARLAAQDDK